MSDPIVARMSESERAEYERMKREGYSLLQGAHAIYMRAAAEKKQEAK